MQSMTCSMPRIGTTKTENAPTPAFEMYTGQSRVGHTNLCSVSTPDTCVLLNPLSASILH
jgi:hypothetical protein